MIATKLILVEGVPGSGKSTTAQTIQRDLAACGVQSRCYLEWGEDNPIAIGKMADLAEIISTTGARQEQTLHAWREFAQSAMRREAVNIIESRFWQTDAMYLYLSGHTHGEVFESNARIVAAIAGLHPLLIYLAPKDIERLHAEIARLRNAKWRASGKEGSWEEWGDHVYERQKWFTDRSLDARAMAQFFNRWAGIADRLYARFPYRKIKIQDPQIDWDDTRARIRDFLEINTR